MTIGTGMWAIIVPSEKRNLATNPSLELGTAGWGTLQGGTVGTTSSVQAFGAWAGSIAPSNNGTAGVLGPTFTASNGSAYAYSVYGSLPVGSVYRFGIGDSNGASIVGTFLATGGGTWHRYIGSFTEASGATRRLAVRKNSNALTDAFYLDGLQYEQGSVTTYLDGDQEGCLWDGAPQASSSLRSGTSRAGGSIYALNSLGMTVLEHGGIGMPDVTNVMQDYGLLDGAYFQRQRANVRAFILTGLFSGTTYQGLHALRQAMVDVLKIDLTPNPQPARFLYNGAGGLSQIDALYDSGLQFGERSGFAETAAIRFVAPDPYFYATRDTGTALPGFTAIGSMNYLSYRDPYGRWGTLGVNGTTVLNLDSNRGITCLAYSNGTLYFGGDFGTVGGTLAPRIGRYSNGQIGTLQGGTVGASGGVAIEALAVNAGGTLYFGGNFVTIQGTTALAVGQWTGAFGTLTGGTVQGGGVFALNTQVPGTLVLGGAFGTAGGTRARFVAIHNGANFGTLTNGTVNGNVVAIAYTGRTLVLGGALLSAAGTTATNVVFWGGSFGTFAGGGVGESSGASGVTALAVMPDYRVAIGGAFGTVSGQPGTNVGLADLTAIVPMGLGLGTSVNDSPNALTLAPNGRLWAGGDSNNTGPVPSPDALFQWTGANWLPGDANFPIPNGFSANDLKALIFSPDGTLYAGGFYSGIGTVASVATEVNSGGAVTPMTIVLRGPTSGTARMFQVLNTLTNSGAYFDLVVQAGEIITITTESDQVSVVSSARGNLMGAVLPGSNLSKLAMQPGTNYLSVFADNVSLRADIYWRPRAWSADQVL